MVYICHVSYMSCMCVVHMCVVRMQVLPSMEAAVAQDLAHTRERGLHANEAMRTVRFVVGSKFQSH